MLSSQNITHVLVASANERTLCFPIKLLIGNQTVKTTTLIDSGATGNFLDLRLLSLANFPLQKLPQPIQAYNVDGTTNQKELFYGKPSFKSLPSNPMTTQN
jgi:hypothetical protein